MKSIILLVLGIAGIDGLGEVKKCESPKYDLNAHKISVKVMNKDYINQTSAKVIPMNKDEKLRGFKFSACIIKQFSESVVIILLPSVKTQVMGCCHHNNQKLSTTKIFVDINVLITAKAKNAPPKELAPQMGTFCEFFEKDGLKETAKPLFYKSSFPIDDKCPWKTGCFNQLKVAVDAHNYPCEIPYESYILRILICEKDCLETANHMAEIKSEVLVRDKAQK